MRTRTRTRTTDYHIDDVDVVAGVVDHDVLICN